MPAKRPDPATVALGETVARLRKSRGWQQSDLAAALSERLGRSVDPSLITRLERGQRNTSAPEVAALAAILDVPAAAILDESDPFFETGFEGWEMRGHLEAARASLARAAYDYGSTSWSFSETFRTEPIESAAEIAERAETKGWNAANGER